MHEVTIALSLIQLILVIGVTVALIFGTICGLRTNVAKGIFSALVIVGISAIIAGIIYKVQITQQQEIIYQTTKTQLSKPWNELVNKIEEPDRQLKHDLFVKKLLVHQFLQREMLPKISLHQYEFFTTQMRLSPMGEYYTFRTWLAEQLLPYVESQYP